MKLLTHWLGMALLASSATVAAEVNGLIKMESPYPARQTMDRLEAVVKERGLTVFARIDHTAGAASIDKTLRPTELLIFGSPQGGTPLMECAQTAAIELPLKALVWEDASSQVWLGYNAPMFIAERHNAGDCPVVAKLTTALTDIANAVVAKQP